MFVKIEIAADPFAVIMKLYVPLHNGDLHPVGPEYGDIEAIFVAQAGIDDAVAACGDRKSVV